MIQVYKLYSDNFDGQLVTKDAYNLIRLSMSTGDFHTHRAKIIEVSDLTGVMTREQVEFEESWMTSEYDSGKCPACGK